MEEQEIEDYISKEIDYTEKEKVKDITLSRKYGINLKKYNDLLKEQNYSCAICGLDQSRFEKALSVDHCHTSGKVRGLLCQLCNTGLGSFKDNKKVLEKAIEYLDKTK